ncbi:fluoride efflux transporter CrcB [soil metagenome]
MKQLLLIAGGGAAGSVLRYLMALGVYGIFGRAFPYGTLVVNISGCFIMGLLAAILLERVTYANELRGLLLIGFLGGYTTFSSFAVETLNLVENGEMMLACTNVLLSVVLCLVAVWLGLVIGRQI